MGLLRGWWIATNGIVAVGAWQMMRRRRRRREDNKSALVDVVRTVLANLGSNCCGAMMRIMRSCNSASMAVLIMYSLRRSILHRHVSLFFFAENEG